MREPSERAKSLIGKEVTVESNRKGKSGTGLVEGVRMSQSTIYTPRGPFPGVEFLIRPNDGRRAFWTVAMPDEDPS